MNEAAGAVENIIELPDDPDPTTRPYTPPAGRILVDDDGTAQAGGSWDGVAFQPPPSSPLEEIRAAALLNVDTSAEAARQRFISPGDGKMLSYEAKRGEAESWAADDAPDPANYPWARSRAARLNGVAEIEVTVAQAQAVIDEWTARIAGWRAAGWGSSATRRSASP